MRREMAVCVGYQGIDVRGGIIVSVKTQLFVALLLIVALSVKIWIKSESTQVGYVLAAARQTGIELDMKRRELELQRSVYLRPDHLKQKAAERLGLQAMSPHQAKKVIYVN